MRQFLRAPLRLLEAAPEPRRSARVSHFCSFKVTHTENTIWNGILPAGKEWAAISSAPKACALHFHHRAEGT